MAGRGIAMVEDGLRLGEFGDERLAKREVCCCRGWWRGRAPACAVWPAADAAASLGFRGFLAIPG